MPVRYIQDYDVRSLATISRNLKGDYERDDDIWMDSPFAWIKRCPSRQIGKIGEQLVSGWIAAKGLGVFLSTDSGADRIIEGQRAEIKFSTLWKNGSFTFQQIRNQDYSIVICLGISPFDAFGWCIPKGEALKHARPQHGGAVGTDTKWFSVTPGAEPDWLKPWGGRLSKMYEVLLELCSKPSDR